MHNIVDWAGNCSAPGTNAEAETIGLCLHWILKSVALKDTSASFLTAFSPRPCCRHDLKSSCQIDVNSLGARTGSYGHRRRKWLGMFLGSIADWSKCTTALRTNGVGLR